MAFQCSYQFVVHGVPDLREAVVRANGQVDSPLVPTNGSDLIAVTHFTQPSDV